MRPLRRLAAPVVFAFAVLWFLIDAVMLAAVRPFLGWLGRRAWVLAAQRRIARLGPYPTLALLLAPLVLLEPLKPLGVYVMATGRPVAGAAIVVGCELLKVVTVERLYHASRAKLLTIPWFARGHAVVTGWLAWLRGLAAWRAAARAFGRVRAAARRVLAHIRAAFT